MTFRTAVAVALALAGCGAPLPLLDGGQTDAGTQSDAGADAGFDAGVDAGTDAGLDGGLDAGMDGGRSLVGKGDAGAYPPNPFADAVVSFTPGPGATFGQNDMPRIVLGGPEGNGDQLGSFHVCSLGNQGSIVLELDDVLLHDGPGVDLLVFENPFSGFIETGFVAVSSDGTAWQEWPCDPDDADGGYPGCAGVRPVYANSMNGISATDVLDAGGDGFDLSVLGVTSARFVRIRDSGKNRYQPPAAGFDLDAIAVVNGRLVDGGMP